MKIHENYDDLNNELNKHDLYQYLLCENILFHF